MASGTQALNFNTPIFDMSGKLIIKAQLGDDIRMIPIHNEEITYDELLLMMQRLFRGKIQNSDDVVIKYKDLDGDLITIFDSSDVSFAKSQSPFLKLTVFVNQRPKPLEHDQIKEMKTELVQMRDRLNQVLARLDEYSEELDRNNVTKREEQEAKQPGGITLKKPLALDNKAHAAMFDPLKTEKVDADSTTKAKDPFADVGVPKSTTGAVSSNSYASAGSTPSTSFPQNVHAQQSFPAASSYQQQQQQMQVTDPSNQPVAVAPGFVDKTYRAGPPEITSMPGLGGYGDRSQLPPQQQQQLPSQAMAGPSPASMSMGYDPYQGSVVSSGSQPYPASMQQPQAQPGGPQQMPGGPQQLQGGVQQHPNSMYNYAPMPSSDMNSPAHAPSSQGYIHNQQNPYSRGLSPKTYPQPTQGYDHQYPGNVAMPNVPPGTQVPGLLYPH